MKRKKAPLPRLSHDAELALSPSARHTYRVRRFERFYWAMVICMIAVAALATVVAVVANLLVGVCAGIAVVALYLYFKKDALRRHLHMVCTSADGGLCIASLSAEGEDTLLLPDHLMGLPVRALGDAPFANGDNAAVTVLHLPATLSLPFTQNAFIGLPSLTTVRFAGTAEAWERLSVHCELPSVTVECNASLPPEAIAREEVEA